MKWLHISDIHFNFKGYESSTVRNKLLSALKDLKISVDFILITGDCLYKNGSDGFNSDKIISYIRDIAKSCNCPNNRVYFCQGNHDLDRENADRNNEIDKIRKKKIQFSDAYCQLDNVANEKFQIIVRGVTNHGYSSYQIFAPNNSNYRIISLNSCLLSRDKKDVGKLQLCCDKLIEIESQIRNDNRINILIMHHGVDCLEKKDSVQFQHWMEDHNIDVVFCGHTHRSSVESYAETGVDLKQFTAGAIIIDDYAIPSFYLCEYEYGGEMVSKLFTYSKDAEIWGLDSHSLRKFKDGIFSYKLSRMTLDLSSYKDFIKRMNKMYFDKFHSDEIVSSNLYGCEKFDISKIISSLSNVNMPYEKALDITFQVMMQITDSKFQVAGNKLSCTELKKVIYEKIISQKASVDEKEYTISCWASRYARRYNRHSEMIVQMQNGKTEKINYSYVQGSLLKYIFDDVTGNEIFYLKTSKNELQRMSERILDFLRNIGIFEIREIALLSLVKEYMTQKPHPWLVNDKEQVVSYNKEQAEEHIKRLDNHEKALILQTEAAYHICATFLALYDKVIGCMETSPIITLKTAINGMNNYENFILNKMPMQKYQVFQLKKDLENLGVEFANFVDAVNVIYDFIICRREVTNEKTASALINLWNIIRKLEQKPTYDNKLYMEDPLKRLKYIFECGTGFIVKSPLKDLSSCFWFEPNWEEYEAKQQHLGSQILVCVIKCVDFVTSIFNYLYNYSTKNCRTTELIFVYDNYAHFSKEDRNTIRNVFKGKSIKCIFIQEENFLDISEYNNWRNILFDIIRISKIS